MSPTDTEINKLRAQVEAYRTKMLLLQQEVSVILDKSEKIELMRARELEEMTKARDRLEIKLQKYKTYVKQLEQEKDDLRDSVTEFVDRVELNPGALDLWPRSRMEVKGFLDPLSGFDESKVQVDAPELLSYAVARIASLTQQRDLEHQDFKQMERLFHVQVRTLQAQVARRDATIAACCEHTSHNVADPMFNLDNGTKYMSTALPLSDEQIIKALHRTKENNHALEMEIQILGQKLKQVKSASARPISTSPILLRMAPVPSSVNTIPGTPNSEPDLTLQPEQALTGTEGLEPKTPKPYIDTFSPPLSDVHPASNNSTTISELHLPQLDDLDQQINSLSLRIDAFKEERNILKKILVSQQLAPSQEPTPDGSPPPASAPKYIPEPSQTRSEAQNEHQTQWSTIPAQGQDPQEIKMEVSPSPDSNAQRPDTPWRDINGEENHGGLLEKHEVYDGDGEISMELATPLTPSNIVLPGSVLSRSSRAQSPVDSNEESPRMIRPRILTSPLPLSIVGSPTQPSHTPLPSVAIPAMETVSDLEILRKELSETQCQLRERDQEVASLRSMLQMMSRNEQGN